jgi:hypothetical protein
MESCDKSGAAEVPALLHLTWPIGWCYDNCAGCLTGLLRAFRGVWTIRTAVQQLMGVQVLVTLPIPCQPLQWREGLPASRVQLS